MNKKFAILLLLPALFLIHAASAQASQFTGKKIARVCLYGTFGNGTYTDCTSGKQVDISTPKTALIRIPLNPDGRGFKVYDKNVIQTRSYDEDVGSIINVTFDGIGGNFQIAHYAISLADLILDKGDIGKEWSIRRFGSSEGGGWELVSSVAMGNAPQITYPIAELGNCTSESNCRQYCAAQDNMLACAEYGEKHGLISSEDAARAREFSDVLKGQGPGGCKTADECKNYCSDVSRIDECIGFVEKHNLLPPEELKEARQIRQALQAGVSLPGGCRDKNSCQSYCADSAHGEECLNFAEKSGFVSPAEASEARKVLPFINRGETPGKCKTKTECEGYCSVGDHTTECVNFAEKAGLMTKEEAEIVRKTGGKGPGGCNSKETCDAYCNRPENQNSCFEFAQKYNLIPEEKLKEIKDGMGRLRAGLSQAPEEAVQCLREKFGEDVTQKIENGDFMPNPQDGGLIQGCFAKVLPKIKEKMEQGLKYADSETKDCLEKGLGQDGVEKMLNGEPPVPESGDIIRSCFGSMEQKGMKKLREGLSQMPPEVRACAEEKLGKETVAKIEKGESVSVGPEIGDLLQQCAGSMTQAMDIMMKQAPPEIRDCVKEKIGDPTKIRGQEDVQPFIQECMKNFIPQGIPGRPADFIPKGIPKSAEIPEPGEVPNKPEGFAPQGIPDDACAKFKLAPSCDYVPENVRDMCKKCLSE